MLRPTLLAAICSTATVTANAQTCSCPALLDSVKSTVTNNYPGMADKLTLEAGASFAEMNTRVMQAASLARTDSACYAAVRTWVAWFKDHHLTLRTPQPAADGDHAVAEVRNRPVREDDVRGTTVNGDPILGIWSNDSYRLAVVPAMDDKAAFDAVVLSTGNSDWKAGDVKARFVREGENAYAADWTFGDRSTAHVFHARIVGDILDIEENVLAREWPAPGAPVDLEAYAYDRDPSNPQLRFPQEDVAVFTLKSFAPENLQPMRALLAKNAAKLATTPYWVIDLRGNEGGDMRVGRTLLPYLYTGPIKQYNARKRITRANVDHWWNTYIATYFEELDSAGKAAYTAYRADLLAHEGRLYNADTAAFKFFTADTTYTQPKRVAVLMDGDCVSSGELFIMEARQSKKVTVMGTNSGGMIDYGDVLHYDMPCAGVSLVLPFTRFNWLDEGVRVDAEGLRPEVALPPGTNWLDAATEAVRRAR